MASNSPAIIENGVIKGISTITAGSFVGDATVNRAIAHKGGAIPKAVFLSTPGYFIFTIIPGIISLSNFNTGYAITVWDQNNFYVGNATDYNRTANLNLIAYNWVALF